ncbi:MAG: type I-B CRISPR-associated endonuclease Cas1 [Clostridiales bacterium]|nr:type I-B CRISPR-associated endonuclease Cas1 [Clostridiales bacterium]
MDRSYYLFSSGQLKRNNNTLRLLKNDGSYGDIPIETVYDIYSFGDIVFNSDLVDFLGAKGVCLHFFNYYGYYSASLYPREKLVSGQLLVNQVQHYVESDKRNLLAKLFVKGAAENLLRNLKYYNNRGKDLSNYILNIENIYKSLWEQNSIPEIMGIEGNIRKIYYSAWNIIINQQIDFDKRTKRPPDNMINCLISLLNSILYTKTVSEIYKTQLNPSISYLHQPSSKRFSLSLDISEIFKPLIVDRLIFRLLNRNMISQNDFVKKEGFLRLKPAKLKEVIIELDNFMLTTVHHRNLNRSVSYRHLIRLEIYKIIKHLIEEHQYCPFKIWW